MTSVRLPFSALVDDEIFAVDDTSAQLVVRTSTAGESEIAVRVNGQPTTIATNDGVGISTIDGLEPDRSFRVEVLAEDGRVRAVLNGRTLNRLENATKIATISDVHLGADEFGPATKIIDSGSVPYPMRCGQAAIAEALEWGAEALVIKGDLTDTGAREQWVMAETLLDDVAIPVMITSGNHDVWGTREVMPAEGASSIGRAVDDVEVLDIGHARIVLVDTSLPGKGSGDLSRHSARVLEAVEVDKPVLLFLHHHLQRTPFPWFWPPGIPPAKGMDVISAAVDRNPNMLVSSGHTHRNRRHQLADGRVTFTEVSATSDYPGVWAGYEIASGTIRQTVRRIASPEATSWTEATRAALGTAWPRWSQGRIDDRCVDVVQDPR